MYIKIKVQITCRSKFDTYITGECVIHRGGGERLLPIVDIIDYRNNPKSEEVIGLELASDIYLAGHNFGDEGLTVVF